MANKLQALTEQVTDRTPVALDSLDYAHNIILQGRNIPWNDATAHANFMQQAQALLHPDVALLRLDAYYAASVETRPELIEAMGARTRTGYALRTLLADTELREGALTLARAFTEVVKAPALLQIPSPLVWLGNTTRLATGETPQLDAENADSAAMYVADWLRELQALPLVGVLLDDRGATEYSENPVDLTVYEPVANVCEHYEWALALRRETEILGDTPTVQLVTEEFWLAKTGTAEEFTTANARTATSTGQGQLRFARVAPQANPEQVLRRLQEL